MLQKKIITVFGATGAQGGGLARAILNDPKSEFTVRAVTRDINSDKAKALAKLGAEVVSADLDNLESIKRALKGAYGAYFVTFFWDHFSVEKEKLHAKNMATAAKEVGLQHVIWSTLEDVRTFVPLNDNTLPTLQGKYKVPHFDGKGESDHYFSDAGVPVTYLLTSFYWENLINFGMGPKREKDGKLVMSFPLGNKKMASISSEDIGKCAYGIFKKGKELIGKRVGISGDQITCSDMAKHLSKAIGEEVTYKEVTPEHYRSLGFPGAEDLGNMFQFYRDFDKEFNGVRDMKFAKELHPELQSFETWATKNAKRIPIETK